MLPAPVTLYTLAGDDAAMLPVGFTCLPACSADAGMKDHAAPCLMQQYTMLAGLLIWLQHEALCEILTRQQLEREVQEYSTILDDV